MTEKFKITKIESVSVKNTTTGETYLIIDAGEKFSAHEDLLESACAKDIVPKDETSVKHVGI